VGRLRADAAVIFRRIIRRSARFTQFIAVVIALLAVAGFVYERIGARTDARRFPQIGQSVDVGGRRLNLHCLGQGGPTVVLDSDHGVPGLAWAGVQRRLAQLARTCWYDRAGYGWSEPGPFPRHSNEIARDLHTVLGNGGVTPPYILVGHRFGAFNVRAFGGFFPDEVAGMVLIDPPSDDPAPNNPTVPPRQHIETLRPAMILLFRVLGEVGLWRLMSSDPAPLGFPPREWAALSVLARQPKAAAARVKETPLRASAAQVRAAGDLGDLPLIVVSPAVPTAANVRQRRKFELQTALVKLSKHGRHVILRDIDGMLPYTAPDTVVETIGRVVAEVRRGI
jgi:pimeloyl-ACP methyl ester carboxylesterase